MNKLNTERHHLPIRDGLVMGHVSPDSDSLCSAITLTKYLRSKGKTAYTFIQKGTTPESLKWLIEENEDLIVQDINDTFCRTVRYLYVVDCEPSEARTGFPIDEYKHNWFNVDHHINRFKELPIDTTDVKAGDWFLYEDKMGNEYYFEHSGSTCGIMASNYGFNDDILALGMYHDTLNFSLECVDCCKNVTGLNITNERFQYMIDSCKTKQGKKQYEMIRQLRTWWTNDSEVCIAYDPSNTFDKHQLVSFLRPYCMTLVVVSKNKNVSMRTDHKHLDLSRLSVCYGGGGHKAASGLRIKEAKEIKEIVKRIYKESTNNDLTTGESTTLSELVNELTSFCLKEKK